MITDYPHNSGRSQICPVCEKSNYDVDLMANRILCLPEEYDVLVCASCGLRRLRPQLTDEELADLYTGKYFNSAQFKNFCADGAVEASSDYISEISPIRRTKFNHTVEKLLKIKPDAITFLDVGAATGEMVSVAKNYGLDADGIELSSFAVKKAKERYGIELKQVPISEVEDVGKYDIIHLNHVFEHFNDPVSESRHLWRLLKTGGILYVEVPYQFHVVEKLIFILKRKRVNFTVESVHHPFFYTPNTIRRLFIGNKFEVLKQSTFDVERYPSDTINQKIKMFVWRILSFVGIGNYIELFAKKI